MCIRDSYAVRRCSCSGLRAAGAVPQGHERAQPGQFGRALALGLSLQVSSGDVVAAREGPPHPRAV
eukprot:11532085-Alexandrium_andersonii.AAC.1